jgi:predicted RNase H-like HicB family nuclease
VEVIANSITRQGWLRDRSRPFVRRSSKGHAGQHYEASRVEGATIVTEYTIVIEDAGANFAAYVIGLYGVITTGTSIDEVVENMREAIPFHIEGMRLRGNELLEPMPIVKTIQVIS